MVSCDPDADSTIRHEESLIQFDHVPTYAEFFEQCLVPNRPCIFPPGLIAHWHVVLSKSWTLTDSRSACSRVEMTQGRMVNWEALERDYGSHISPVAITRINSKGEPEEERSDMTITQAINLIQKFRKDSKGVHSIYIKDWHLIKQLRAQQPHRSTEPYTVPDVFADDWMNNIPLPSGSNRDVEGDRDVDDFRFVYAGTCGSQTMLHRDVYTSYSWSTNVAGRKKWFLFPPHVVPHLRRFTKIDSSPLIPDINILLATIALSPEERQRQFPDLEKAWAKVQIVEQETGETIFVPSNWYHQVVNLTECVSINRNWCNSVNLPSLYNSIVVELNHVEESLCDVKDLLSSNSSDAEEWKREFYGLVQEVAVKDAGWAWAGFWTMLRHNLEHPATGERRDLRPRDGWVKKRLLPLVEDFQTREDAKWLDADIRETASKCKVLLQNMSD